ASQSAIAPDKMMDAVAALNGTVMQMFNHGLSSAGMFLLAGGIYHKTHTRDLTQYGGFWVKAPIFGGLFVFMSMSSLGLPGLNGFVGEFLIVRGTWTTFTWLTALSLVGLLFTGFLGAYFLNNMRRTAELEATNERLAEEVNERKQAEETLLKTQQQLAKNNRILEERSQQLAKANQELRADRILIATGGRPFVPNIPGAEMGITSNEAFHIQQLPKKILVNGGGYIAVEFAGIFAGLGVETTLLYRGDQILRGFDSDVRDMVAEQMKARGVTIKLESEITRMDRCASGNIDVSFSTGEVIDFGEVMFATGRVPNIEGLGLETANVKLNAGRAIHVDAYSQTSCPSIYAVGDVTNRAALTPVAIREGAAFVETVYNNNPMAVDHSLIPTAVFSEPEIGTVGLTEHDAASSRAKVNVYVSTFRPMQNTLTTRPEKMMFKLITDGETDEVLGVHIVGPSSGEMIQMVGIAVSMGATKADFDRTIAVHPTAAEELVTLKAPSYVIENGERQS
ncbi:FAD-dependent oxidoreductase, partial [uncultured Maritalea sp.]|uniref:FAD-dependent oxidoreductase n=1 Tax=uncultured Maritalea sp. TaxID=757249 RepID=UPI002602124D